MPPWGHRSTLMETWAFRKDWGVKYCMAPEMRLGLRSPGYQTSLFIYQRDEAKDEVRKSRTISLEF